ncbi:cellulase [Spirochaetia bacterium]|nr:cellulase [Spirochaetia bacterium]
MFLPLMMIMACISKPSGSGAEEKLTIPDTENNDYPLEPMTDIDALTYFQDNALDVGWNLGNTLDAYRSGKAHETVWGNPPVNQAIFSGVKAAGFNIVRIPISWMGNFGEGPDYHIDETYLQRVAEVVGFAHNAGLKVIINIHHDGSTDSNGKDNGWLSMNRALKGEAEYREVTANFRRLWTQIAAYFKNYGDYLMFESMNEIHDGGWGWRSETIQRPQYEIVNQWNQVFVDAIRSTGGNNTARFLVIPGYCTVPKHTLADYFKLPDDLVSYDSVSHDLVSHNNKLIVTYHYYDPYEFGILGTRHNWGSDADKEKVVNDFKPFAEKFVDGMGIPVIMGECGAVRHPGYEQTRLDYLSFVFKTAHENKIVPIYWDNGAFAQGETFGLFNRRSGEPQSPEFEDCINAMVQAVR